MVTSPWVGLQTGMTILLFPTSIGGDIMLWHSSRQLSVWFWFYFLLITFPHSAQPDNNLNVFLEGTNVESMLNQFVSAAHAKVSPC